MRRLNDLDDKIIRFIKEYLCECARELLDLFGVL